MVLRNTVCEVIGPNVPALPHYHGRVPLPIASVVRRGARHIAVRDQSDFPLPHMTRTDERRATARGIAQLATETFRTLPLKGRIRRFDKLEDAVMAAIDPGYGHREPTGEDHWLEFVAGSARFSNLAVVARRAYEARAILALANPGDLKSLLTLTEQHAETTSLREASISGALLAWWRSRWPSPESASLRFHWTRTEGKPVDLARLTLVSTDGSAVEVDEYQGETAIATYREMTRTPFWTTDTFIVTYRLTDMLECESYHVDVTVPTGIYIHQADLRVPNKNQDLQESELMVIRDDDARPDHAHLHFSRRISRRNAADRDYSSALLRLVLRPTYHDGLRAGLNVSAVATATLWILFAVVGWRSGDRECLMLCSETFGDLDTNSVVSLLILTPSVAIGLLVRQNEHDLTKRIQGPLKVRLSAVAVILFVAALLTALNPLGKTLYSILLSGAILTSVLTVPTGLSAIVSALRLREIAKQR